MKNRKVLIYGATILITMLILVISFAFAFLGANQNLVNNLPVNITFADGVAANFTVNGVSNISLNIPGPSMLMDHVGEAVAQNSIDVNITLQSSMNITCSYAITWNWLSDSDTYEKSITPDNEFVVSGTDGTQVLGEINVPYSIEGSMVLGRYVISTDNATTTQKWTFASKFYNLNVNQDIHENKTYKGQIAIENAHCYEASRPTLANYIINNAASSGTDLENNKWYFFSTTHSSDSKTDYRYAGANPNNFIEFNRELWRIIGVMPVDYDTNSDGKPDTQGNLVKIIRNTTFSIATSLDYKQAGIGSSSGNGSNVWSDSQHMIMTNPSTFYASGYNVNNKVIFYNSYVRGEYVYAFNNNNVSFYRNPASLWWPGDYTAYRPTVAYSTSGFTSTNSFNKCTTTTTTNCFKSIIRDAQGMVATVKWNLGGYNTLSAPVETIYANERGTSVYLSSTARPVYWYGKVGLIYISDWIYSSGGSNDGTTYPRANCLSNNVNTTGNYRTYCTPMSFIYYKNATDSSKGTNTTMHTMTPYSGNATQVYMVSSGYPNTTNAYNSYNTKLVLYLDPRAVYISGDGSYNNPYRFL